MTGGTTDSFLKHLRQWLTVHLPGQAQASPNTIKADRDTWNMLLRYVNTALGVPTGRVGFDVIDRECVAGILRQAAADRQWAPATYNQRLARIRSFFR